MLLGEGPPKISSRGMTPPHLIPKNISEGPPHISEGDFEGKKNHTFFFSRVFFSYFGVSKGGCFSPIGSHSGQ